MKSVFSLSKSNMLYGNLTRVLESGVTTYKSWFPFEKTYLVSDSREKSWRKDIYDKYKASRKRDTDIDWEFVYQTYSDFKENFSKKGFRILEAANIEGDDWISYILDTANKKGISNIIVSNDYDIKQLLKFNVDENFINIMTNEMYNKTKLFMPKNYNIFFAKLKKFNNNDIFSLNNNQDFYKLISSFLERHEIIEIDPIKSLLLKIISGDVSDNIESVYTTYGATGKPRGIGEKGGLSIIEKYITEFGEPILEDDNLISNIADLVMEKRKVNSIYMDDIIKNINLNKKIIDLRLSNLPANIVSKMKNKIEENM